MPPFPCVHVCVCVLIAISFRLSALSLATLLAHNLLPLGLLLLPFLGLSARLRFPGEIGGLVKTNCKNKHSCSFITFSMRTSTLIKTRPVLANSFPSSNYKLVH
ncbi:hypothetical protein FKM82_008774 [Ascaphus truei]